MADSHTHRASGIGRHRATCDGTFGMGSTRARAPTGAGPLPQCSRTPSASCRDEVDGTARWMCSCAGVQSRANAAALTHVRRPPTSAARRSSGAHPRVTSHERRTRSASPSCTATRMPWVVKPAAFSSPECAAPPRAASQAARSAVERIRSWCRARRMPVGGNALDVDGPRPCGPVREARSGRSGIPPALRHLPATGDLTATGPIQAVRPAPARSPVPGTRGGSGNERGRRRLSRRARQPLRTGTAAPC